MSSQNQVGKKKEPVEITCYECVNYLMGNSGSWCAEFREPILNEDIAQECGFFTLP